MLFQSPLQADEISLQVGQKNFHYFEVDAFGNELNREVGSLNQIDLTYVNSIFSQTNFIVSGAISGNRVTYIGQTQQGVPHNTQTDEMFYQGSVSLEKVYEYPTWTNRVQFNYGLTVWDRDIQPKNAVLGLFERYQWQQLGFDLQSEKQFGKIKTFGKIGYSLLPLASVTVDLTEIGYSNIKIPMPMGNQIDVSFGISTLLNEKFSASLQWSHLTRKFQVSDSVFTSNGSSTIGLLEPKNETSIEVVTIEISYQL